MSDFARLFAPNGMIDRFFAQNLAPIADMSGKDWDWKQDTRLGRELSKTALRDFQRAAEIRDAFFPQGGAMPNVNVTITPFRPARRGRHGAAQRQRQVVQTHAGRQRCRSPSSGRAAWRVGPVTISLDPGDCPAVPRRVRPRAVGVDAAARMRIGVARPADGMRARFVIGGRDVIYTIQVGSVANPFFLPALTQFTCPTGL